MSRTGAIYDCHIILTILWEIVILVHVKRQILMYFLWRHFSARSSFYCFIWQGIQKGVYKKYSMSQFLWYDCTFKKQCTVPVTLTVDLRVSILFWLRPYKCPVRISDRYLYYIYSSREIKYRNMGLGLLQVKRRTRQKWREMTSDRHDFMRNSNFGMGVLHVKVKYWRNFCDVIYSLLTQVFIA